MIRWWSEVYRPVLLYSGEEPGVGWSAKACKGQGPGVEVAQDPSTSAPRIILREERYPGKMFRKAEEDFEGKYLDHLGM